MTSKLPTHWMPVEALPLCGDHVSTEVISENPIQIFLTYGQRIQNLYKVVFPMHAAKCPATIIEAIE